MDIQVKVYKSNGLSEIALVDTNCIPVCPYSAVYISTHLDSFQFNTRLRYAYELKFILAYFNSKNINLVDKVHSGELLLNAQLKAFFSAAKFSIKSDLINVVQIKKFSSKQLENAIHANKISVAHVKADVTKGRIKRLADYLDFLFDEFHFDNSIPSAVYERKNIIQRKCKSEIRSLKDFNQECRDLDESPLPSNKMFELLEIIQPDSPKNPFKHSKLRNSLIVKILLETGIRRGACAKLKISDCKFYGSYDQINITKSPNDKSDTRAIKAQQKTKAHPSYLQPRVMRELKHYIDTTRAGFKRTVLHDFVFVSELDSKGTAGQPLSLNSITAIFNKLSDALGLRVHAHLLRHKWNEMLSDLANEKNMTFEQTEDLRKYCMGWSEKSEMTSIYNEFKLHVKARELAKERQDAFTKAKSQVKEFSNG